MVASIDIRLVGIMSGSETLVSTLSAPLYAFFPLNGVNLKYGFKSAIASARQYGQEMTISCLLSIFSVRAYSFGQFQH
jgi:hypothetical protein